MQPLTSELLPDASYSHLYLRLGPEALDVAIYNPMEEHSLIYRQFPLASSETGRHEALEGVVYDNPLLLADFKKTRIIVETERLLVVPKIVARDTAGENIFRMAHPDAGADETLLNDPLHSLDAAILAALPRDEAGFLRRTFNNAPISTSIGAFARYCRSTLGRGNTMKAFVNVRPGSLDIVVESSEHLRLANRFAFRFPSDAIYYILAATDQAEAEVSEILLTGDRAVRDELMPELRRFRPYVMPMIFPSAMYRAGAQAMNAPFDLIILPLCE